MSWPTEKLGRLASFINGKAFKSAEWEESGTPIIRIQNLTDHDKPFNYTTKEHPERYRIQDRDILFSWSGTPATSFGCFRWTRGPAWLNQHIFRVDIRDSQKLNGDYFIRAVNSVLNEIIGQAHGGVGLRHITKAKLVETEIPLPPLEEQKRIASVLDKADTLRRLRQQSLDLTEELIQSVFLHMFGDPISNSKGWPTEIFENWLESIDGGWSPKCLKRRANAGEWGVLKLGAVTKCEFDESEQKALPVGLDPRPFLEVKTNDLLFGRKNTHQHVAAAAYVWNVRPKLMISDLIFRLRLKPESKIEKKFLWRLLLHPSQRIEIQQLAGGAAGSMPNISKANLKKITLINPPIELQKKFSTVVSLIHNQKLLLEQQKDVAEDLYSSLQQRVFRGELDLSNLILEEEVIEIIDTTNKLNKLVRDTLTRPVGSEKSLKLPKPSASIEKKLKSQDKIIEENNQITWSLEYFKFRLLAKQPKEISITDLMSQAESVFTESNYDAIRDILFEYLAPAKGKPILTQTFDEKRKEIILQPA